MIAMDLVEFFVRIFLIPYFFVLAIGVVVAILTRGRWCKWALEHHTPYRRRDREDDDDASWL